MQQHVEALETNPSSTTLIGCALRDFFIAENAQDLHLAYAALSRLIGELPEADEALEFAFNRFFVGPAAPLAPPYASVYLDEEGLLMRPCTLDVRRFYQALGLRSPWQGVLPDDHLALELDACLHLHEALLQDSQAEVAELYRAFLEEHIFSWVPLFVHRIEERSEAAGVIRAVAGTLIAWFEEQRSWLKGV